MPGRGGQWRWAGVALAVSVSVACSSPPPQLPGATSGSRLPGVPDPADVVVPGKVIWQTRLPRPFPDNRHVGVVDRWFVAYAYDEQETTTANVAVGRLSDGGLVGFLRIPETAAWPVVAQTEGRLLAHVVQTDGDRRRVSAYDVASGRQVWSHIVANDDVSLAGVIDGRVIVQPRASRYGLWTDTHLVALSAQTGKQLWRSHGHPVRGTFLGPKAIATLYRTDGALDAEADRVELRDPADGRVTADIAWSDVRQDQPTAIPVPDGTWLLTRNDIEPRTNRIQLIRADGSRVWRQPMDGKAVVDTETGTVVVKDFGGDLVGRVIRTGKPRWRIASDTVANADLELDRGAYGWLVGSAGPHNVVLAAETGAFVYDGTFEGSDPARWGEDVYVTWSGADMLSAVTGPSFPPGVLADVSPTDLLFLRR